VPWKGSIAAGEGDVGRGRVLGTGVAKGGTISAGRRGRDFMRELLTRYGQFEEFKKNRHEAC
jgi:hypothetical protein